GRKGKLAVAAAACMLIPVVPALAARSGPTLPDLTTPTPSNPLPGATRLPNGWGLDPAGTQMLTSRATTGVTTTPDGQTVYAVTSGIFEEALERANASDLIATKTLVGDAYQGVAADANGDVWVSGGPDNAVFQYKAVGPAMVDVRQAGPAPDAPNRGIPVTGYPGNLLLAGDKLFVAGTLSVPTAAAQKAGGRPCADDTICSVVSVIDVSDPTATSPTVHAIPVGRDAYGLAYRAATSTLYVTNWADQTNTNPARDTGTVSVVRVAADGTGQETQVVPVGPAPTGIAISPDGTVLAVANSDDDSISLLSTGATGLVADVRRVKVGLPGQPPGTTPLSVAFSPDGSYLYVGLAGLDSVQVLTGSAGGNFGRVGRSIPQTVTVSYAGHPVVVRSPDTYIPTGWYPDAMTVTGNRLYVANLRGNGAGPGYYGQLQPAVGTSTEGTVSAVDIDPAQFDGWTARVIQADQLAPVFTDITDPATDACANGANDILCLAQRGQIDPKTIHVVQILAENKTFDSYFGDTGPTFPAANAVPTFTEYGAPVTTNQHQLAQAFSLSDNFWNEGAESSVLGHSWITGGYTTPNNELTWGQSYDQGLRDNRGSGQYTGGVTGGSTDPTVAAQEDRMFNPRQRLSDEVVEAGLSAREYGTDVNPGSPSAPGLAPQGPWGEGPTSPVSTDLAFPDVDRANIFLHGQTTSHAWDVLETPTPPKSFGQPIGFSPADSAKYTLDGWNGSYALCRAHGSTDVVCQQSMPNYLYMELPENHTYDVSNVFNPVDPTPQSMVADNDYAIGLILQGLSHSPFWKNTLVLITEDDNQFTGDHVDIHRTFLLAAGGLSSRLGPTGQVSDEVGSFASAVKTTEVLLDLPPMTLFDSRAEPLHQMVAASVPGPSTGVPTYTAVRPPTPFLIGQ
ncbi:MAG TPA: bifunctional YncE family protein/alkaline phosphatase family protein, partial [Acidimicrobiales bacterium]|nr:bifunctional YncE family protein/alkaline phosphatase family protein [Acidimicrobiales bacterium]